METPTHFQFAHIWKQLWVGISRPVEFMCFNN